jgi:hypothetical protein
MINTQLTTAELFTSGWNNLDFQKFFELLDENTEYQSIHSSSTSPLKGRDEISYYFHASIGGVVERREKVIAKLSELTVDHGEYAKKGDPCVVLTGGPFGNTQIGVVYFKVKKDQVKRFDLIAFEDVEFIKKVEPTLTKLTFITEFSPPGFVVDPKTMFPSSADDWSHHCSDQGLMRLKPTIAYGVTGIQGSLALGNQPRKVEVDAWEASKPAGVWDYWGFLGFMRLPAEDYTIEVFFGENTFFERPFENVLTKKLDAPGEEDEWEYIYREIFIEDFGAASLEGQTWTEGDTVWDASAPDE